MALDGYRIRWFPEILVYGEYAADGLTMQGANTYVGHVNNFYGYLHYLRFEIKARGIETVLSMIHEALDIAHDKGMPDEEIAAKLDLTRYHVKRIKRIRRFHQVYGMLSKKIKQLLGDNVVASLKRKLKK